MIHPHVRKAWPAAHYAYARISLGMPALNSYGVRLYLKRVQRSKDDSWIASELERSLAVICNGSRRESTSYRTTAGNIVAREWKPNKSTTQPLSCPTPKRHYRLGKIVRSHLGIGLFIFTGLAASKIAARRNGVRRSSLSKIQTIGRSRIAAPRLDIVRG